MTTPLDRPSPEFRRLVEGDPSADVTRIALELAGDAYPELDPTYYLDTLDALAERVGERCPARPRPQHILQQVNWVLYVEEHFQGNADDYYDPRNSYLNQVIDRRVGIPISLSILYRAIAERLGVEMAGVNLPAHFVLRTQFDQRPVFVDPYHGGVQLDLDGCRRRVHEVTGQWIDLSLEMLAPCSTVDLVSRMLRNLKAVYLNDQDFASAWPVQRRLANLLAGEPLEQRDLGLIALKLDRPGAAAEALQAYLTARPNADDAAIVDGYLRLARREIASRN